MAIMYTLTHSYVKGITYFVLTHFMYVLSMALTINSDYLPKQHKMVDLCNRQGLCSLEVGPEILCTIYMYFR